MSNDNNLSLSNSTLSTSSTYTVVVDESEPKLTLVSGDGVKMEITELAAKEIGCLKSVIEANTTLVDTPIDLPASTLKKIIEHTEHLVRNPRAPRKEKKPRRGPADKIAIPYTKIKDAYDIEFVNVPYPELRTLIHAANQLDAAYLLDLTAKAIANLIKGKTPEQIRVNLGIDPSQFTEEQKEEIRKEIMGSSS